MTKECIFYTKENPFWSSKAGAQLLLVNDRSGTLQNYDFSMNSGFYFGRGVHSHNVIIDGIFFGAKDTLFNH